MRRVANLAIVASFSFGVLAGGCASNESTPGQPTGAAGTADGGVGERTPDSGGLDAPGQDELDASDGAPMDPTDARPDAIGTVDGSSPLPQFDWVGIIGTGQSLSVGALAERIVSDKQPFHNLKLLDTGPDPKYPVDGGGVLSLVPLVELIRPRLAGYADAGGEYPDNIRGETPHSSMANQISALSVAQTGRDYVTLHSVVGWSGKCIDRIDKAGGGNGYPGSLSEGRAFVAKAKAAGKSFGYGAVILTHGECDNTNANYGAQVHQLWADYNTDLKKLHGRGRAAPPISRCTTINTTTQSISNCPFLEAY